MRKINDFMLLEGAVVIDNCATIRLASGEAVLWDGIINPEEHGVREFADWDYSQSVNLILEIN
jgi:hypothetical protein